MFIRRNLSSLLLASLLALATLSACGPKKNAKEERAGKGDDRLAELMSERRQRLSASIPASDVPDGSTHPWLNWVSQVAGTVSRAELKKVAVVARGTATANTADELATWLESQKAFYFEEKMAAMEYWRDLSIARNSSVGKPWQVDLDFDQIFFHAAQVARTADLFARAPDDDRVTHYFNYWLLVFGFEAKTSLYQDETNKLCKEKLAGFCDPIPMELRPYQVMKPYYQKVQEMIAAFRKAWPGSVYEPFLQRLDAVYAKRISEVPAWSEDPKLVSMRSGVPAPLPGNAVLYVTAKGVSLMENALRKPDDPARPWKPDWAPDPELGQAVSALVQDVRSSTVSNFNQSRILVVPDADVPMRYLEPLLRSTIIGEHAQEWPTVILVGRRRADGSNERVGFTLSLLDTVKAIPFKLDAPAGGAARGKLSCTAFAVVGAQRFEAKGFASAVFHDGKSVHVGRLSLDGAYREVQSAPGHGEGDRLEAWTDAQTASVVVAVPKALSYAALVEALNGVALRCTPQGCKQDRTVPVFVATCD